MTWRDVMLAVAARLRQRGATLRDAPVRPSSLDGDRVRAAADACIAAAEEIEHLALKRPAREVLGILRTALAARRAHILRNPREVA